ncbi:hypothetical protein [Granulicella tundricola]|uniref:Uncharacterized protein n=1 Tax=Granulicella tundricola (strain ATCC BAA-1859 / DSM 23138 / MP5ACTX9) TaxID=1198114 RepID=E8X7P4_GRATM|nr:hypothetical protein [Granulicella tundricola]ADW71478.1 hypothetical protein AciX9_4541 [Granulicella tundricola MP5ACTX9]
MSKTLLYRHYTVCRDIELAARLDRQHNPQTRERLTRKLENLLIDEAILWPGWHN